MSWSGWLVDRCDGVGGGWWITRLFVMVLQLRSEHVFLPVAVVLGLSELSTMVATADPTVMLAGACLG
jgi:hypothetical protein